jgi:3-oxoacyl-[acyl-carrier protein] reductase
LVTGGGRGIGAGIVRRLASGCARVALTYVSKPDQAGETVRAASELGGIDIRVSIDGGFTA